jgi:hypothetical protein
MWQPVQFVGHSKGRLCAPLLLPLDMIGEAEASSSPQLGENEINKGLIPTLRGLHERAGLRALRGAVAGKGVSRRFR